MTTNPYPIPVALYRTQPRIDEPQMAEYTAHYWNVETEGEIVEPISEADFYATLSGHRDSIIYSERDFYYAFDMDDAQRDACARWERTRAQAWALEPELAAEMDATIDAFLEGAR